MEFIIAVAAVILVGIQAQRNWLMIQASKKSGAVIEVHPAEICYDSLARAMENSWPAVTVSNDVEIDYDRLAEAFARVNVTVPVTVIGGTQPTYPAPSTPYYPSGPYWVSESNEFNTSPNEHIYTINVSGEEREVPVRKFPK